MRLALSLAQRGLGRVWPNPAVGCVIVKDGKLLGRGWTQSGGRPHAETEALAQAGDAKGATAYVTLEPCAHHGETPPCASALVKAGIARVVSALDDPDSRVAGQGYKILRDAGVEVTEDVLVDAAADLNQGFLLNRTIGRPMFTLKMASSIDGRIATASGESRWITGPEARRHVHLMRAKHDAVLIGAGTARADDPLLDVRDMGLSNDNPVRIILDGGLSLSLTSRLAQTAKDVPLWICHRAGLDKARRKTWEEIGATLIEVAHSDTGELDLADMAIQLGKRGLTRVLCEGGGHLASSMIAAELVDTLVTFTAGLAIGSEGGAVFGPLQIDALADAPRFDLVQSRTVGHDIMTTWKPNAR
ncbi:MAG: bifunctional diaminohydroxyphosphoribosylaminopyrimidine deaminase/5-amino-6-(5-phosphoribosylamino)uracil reductase RibD [Rhodobacteraceae bacterium]|nr:bifunctional diaminohydroxyphosphoribosylaminopyrimidine deaminase/5-amino-6-(5-phosphoribosylamino)uracil reductase RibD [Paracoccaceae bacterium]